MALRHKPVCVWASINRSRMRYIYIPIYIYIDDQQIKLIYSVRVYQQSFCCLLVRTSLWI